MTSSRKVRLTPHPNPSELTAEQLELWEAAQSTNSSRRWAAARNRSTPIEALTKLASDKSLFVRVEVAGNPNAPVGVLVSLANDEDKCVRDFVAYNPSAPVEALMKLAVDEEVCVRFRVAASQNAPIELLVSLANDEGLIKLANHEDVRVRLHALENEKLKSAAIAHGLAVERFVKLKAAGIRETNFHEYADVPDEWLDALSSIGGAS